jgi:hypothetical protein
MTSNGIPAAMAWLWAAMNSCEYAMVLKNFAAVDSE